MASNNLESIVEEEEEHEHEDENDGKMMGGESYMIHSAPVPEPSITEKKWMVGDCIISRGLLEFMFPALGILILLVTALVGVFKDPTNTMWAQLLFLVAGVLTPNPKLNTDKSSITSSQYNTTPQQVSGPEAFLRRHYTEDGPHYSYPQGPPGFRPAEERRHDILAH